MSKLDSEDTLLSPAGARAVTSKNFLYGEFVELLSPAGARVVTLLTLIWMATVAGYCPPQGRELLRWRKRWRSTTISCCCPPQGREVLHQSRHYPQYAAVAVPRRGTGYYVVSYKEG